MAHNSYLQIWAECGTPALATYLTMMLLTLVSLWRIRRKARQRYFTDVLTRLINGWPNSRIDELMPWHFNQPSSLSA